MSQTRLPFTRIALVAGIVTVSALSCSCTSSDPPPSTTATSASVGSSTATTPSTGTSAPTTGTSVQAVDIQLHDAIDAFWKLFVEVGGRNGPWDEATTRSILQQRATGTELEQLITIFQGNAVAGYVVRGSMQISPTVVSVDGDTAMVRDCVDDTTGVYRSDGTRVDTDDPLRHQYLMTLERHDGVWKVAAIKDEGTGCTA